VVGIRGSSNDSIGAIFEIGSLSTGSRTLDGGGVDLIIGATGAAGIKKLKVEVFGEKLKFNLEFLEYSLSKI
jgi:hypothetical protein